MTSHCFPGFFWDSLEHIKKPWEILTQAGPDAFVFVSLPIVDGEDMLESVLASKHFKPEEHYWYFTREGFMRFAAYCGFEVVHHSDEETKIGRESIETFVLCREKPEAAEE